MNLAQSNILVTGAGGFIGSHLVDALMERGCEVTAMIRYTSRADLGNLEFLPKEKKARLKVVAGDVRDPHFVLDAVRGKDVVFHLAALIGIPYSYVAPQSYVQTNIEGTVNVLEAARRLDISRIIHTSTSECYGSATYIPIDEKHPLQPQSPYSGSKIAADMMADSFYRSFAVPVTIVRPFNTFGPRQSARAVVPAIISQALGDQRTIALGALLPIRDLTYVSDTIEGFVKAAECDDAVGRVINIGTGMAISIGDLARLILKLTCREKPIFHDLQRDRPEKSEVRELVANTELAQQLLGWVPKYTLEKGLLETIGFVSQHMDLFRAGKYTI